MHFSRLATVVLFLGCNTPPDIAVNDSGVDSGTLLDAGPPAVPRHFMIDVVRMPSNTTEARQYGLDLNGDGTVDNQFGVLTGTLAGQGLENRRTQDAIETGSISVLLDVITPDLTTASSAKVRVLVGANPMPTPCASDGGVDAGSVCGQHLKGTGSFTFVPRMPEPAALVGSISGGVLNAGPGELSMALSVLGSQPVLLHLQSARVRLSGMTATTVQSGIIAGGISESELDVNVYPSLQTSYAALVARDCTMTSNPPECGCLSGSTGKTLLALFDAAPKNCQVSVAEIKGTSLIQALLAPDLAVDGGADARLLSFGVGISAVKGAYLVGGE